MKGHRLYAALYDVCVKLSDRQMAPYRLFAAEGATGRVLEIGAGTGANLAYYRWAMVESLDLTEPDRHMARKARKKLLSAPEGRVRLHEAPAEALPFPDAGFDTVVSTLVLCTVDDPAAALAEIRRVLKPDGSLRLVEHVRAEGWWGGFQDFVQPVYGWMAAGCVLGRPTEEYLIAAGFRVEVHERPNFARPMPGLVAVAYPDLFAKTA